MGSINRGYGNPTAKEILNDDSDADIIKVDDVIYLKADNKPDGDYSKGEEIGEIKKKTANKWWFRNLYASKLDKGTKVYSIDEEYQEDRKSTRLNSSHVAISYAVFCLK